MAEETTLVCSCDVEFTAESTPSGIFGQILNIISHLQNQHQMVEPRASRSTPDAEIFKDRGKNNHTITLLRRSSR